jgi:hypothetical protein
MLYAVATWADTYSNHAIKDPGQQRRGYSNLGKIVINLWLRGKICRKIPLPDILRLSATLDAFITVPFP